MVEKILLFKKIIKNPTIVEVKIAMSEPKKIETKELKNSFLNKIKFRASPKKGVISGAIIIAPIIIGALSKISPREIIAEEKEIKIKKSLFGLE